MNKTPDSLKPLENMISKFDNLEMDNKEYADIAFSLVKASSGCKKSINIVSEYIQKQHDLLQLLYGNESTIKTEMITWLSLAIVWTNEQEQKKENENDTEKK